MMLMLIIIICLPPLSHVQANPPKPSPPSVTRLPPSDLAPLIGYDCNQTEPEILTVSTLEVGPCPALESLKPEITTIYGQLLQKHNLEYIHVRTCQMTKSTFYFKCGHNSANYQVYPPSVGITREMRVKTCDSVHETGILSLIPHKEPWTDLFVNKTYTFSVNEVGWTDQWGYCEGGEYRIAGITHKDIVVQSSITVSLRESWTLVDKEAGTINIENRVSCPYKEGFCHDDMSGTHIWISRKETCGPTAFVMIYSGPVNITKSPHNPMILLSINSPPILFTSELGFPEYNCFMSLEMTEFPGIYLAKQINGQYQGQFASPTESDIKLITYLNAKLTFTYHHLMDMARELFLNAIQKVCEVEREMLKNRIEIVRLNSESGGLSTLMKSGTFARTNGEVLHLIKCQPVPVHLRQSEKCHEALPISIGDRNVFLLPNTHIISEFSAVIPCSTITPVTYMIGGKWWAYSGSFSPVENPTVLQPHTTGDLPFRKIQAFGRGGMYSSEQIENVQKLLQFPHLRKAITTDISSGISQYFGGKISMDITSIMSDHDWTSIAQSHLETMWGHFQAVGSFFSGLLGIYFVYKICSSVLSTALNAKELYMTFGLSFRLVAALCTRFALYLINQARNTRDQGTSSSSTSPPEMSSGSSDPSAPASPDPTAPALELREYRSVLSPVNLYPRTSEETSPFIH